jgi:hypothetical protein
VACEVEIHSLTALEKAAEQCGLVLKRNQKTHRWYGEVVGDYQEADAAQKHGVKTADFGKCEHALAQQACKEGYNYEIGLVRVPGKEGFTLVWDHWDYELKEKVGGESAPKLTQLYAQEVTIQKARQLGYAVEQHTDVDGGQRLWLTSYADGHHIAVRIKPDGKAEVKAEGFTGPSCSLATRPFIEALGQAVSEVPLPEMYATGEQQQSLNAREGGGA